MEPVALLLDEPITGLDKKIKQRLIKVIQRLDLSYIYLYHMIIIFSISLQIHCLQWIKDKFFRLKKSIAIFIHTHASHLHNHSSNKK